MKTMGVDDLRLVRPKVFPSDEATARASGAGDLLERCRVHESLEAATAECGYVVGASARLRGMRWPVDDPRSMAANVWSRLRDTPVALVFGPERSGLTNEDMSRCHALVHIPTAADYGSLNLAMSVQVLCYELRMHDESNRISAPESREAPPATAAELAGFHDHLEGVLWRARFLHLDHPTQLRMKLRRIFTRAALDRNEINILRGALAALDPDGASAGAGDDGSASV